MTAHPYRPGTVKARIFDALDGSGTVDMERLVLAVFGEDTDRRRLSVRVNISAMRKELAFHGWSLRGRDELGVNAYSLRRVM